MVLPVVRRSLGLPCLAIVHGLFLPARFFLLFLGEGWGYRWRLRVWGDHLRSVFGLLVACLASVLYGFFGTLPAEVLGLLLAPVPGFGPRWGVREV